MVHVFDGVQKLQPLCDLAACDQCVTRAGETETCEKSRWPCASRYSPELAADPEAVQRYINAELADPSSRPAQQVRGFRSACAVLGESGLSGWMVGWLHFPGLSLLGAVKAVPTHLLKSPVVVCSRFCV